MKKIVIKAVIMLLILIGIYIFMDNDYWLYEKTIGTVESVDNKYVDTVKGKNDGLEDYYEQTLKIQIKNNEDKDKIITVVNEFSISQVKTTEYEKGDDLFLDNKDSKSYIITNVKRDKFTVLIIVLFIEVMVFTAGKRGILTLFTIVINIGIFVFLVNSYASNKNFEELVFIMAIIFSILTLIILNGFTKQNLGTILSTIISVWILIIIYNITGSYSEQLPYEMMDNISGPDDLEVIFRTGIIIGCLGAVMDIAVTVNSSVFEIVRTSEKITVGELVRSIKEIGYDIMGTMINVLFFTFICSSIPITIIKLVNGYSFTNIVRYSMVFDVVRFLTGAIGIVLAIPVSGLIALIFVRKKVLKKNDI